MEVNNADFLAARLRAEDWTSTHGRCITWSRPEHENIRVAQPSAGCDARGPPAAGAGAGHPGNADSVPACACRRRYRIEPGRPGRPGKQRSACRWRWKCDNLNLLRSLALTTDTVIPAAPLPAHSPTCRPGVWCAWTLPACRVCADLWPSMSLHGRSYSLMAAVADRASCSRPDALSDCP